MTCVDGIHSCVKRNQSTVRGKGLAVLRNIAASRMVVPIRSEPHLLAEGTWEKRRVRRSPSSEHNSVLAKKLWHATVATNWTNTIVAPA